MLVKPPHDLEDRAFQEFSLSQEREGKSAFIASLSHKQMGAKFSPDVSIRKSELTGFSVMASFLNYKYGCTVGSTVLLEET